MTLAGSKVLSIRATEKTASKLINAASVKGLVPAAHVAAGEAQSQVDPPPADFQAVFAALGAGRHLLNLIYVLTGHCSPLSK
jgi:hypothetical protein